MKVRKTIRAVVAALCIVAGGVAAAESPAMACRADGVTGGVYPCE